MIHPKRASPIEHVVYDKQDDDNAEDAEDAMHSRQFEVVNVLNGA